MFRGNGKKNLLLICNKKHLWPNFSTQIQYTNGVLMLFRGGNLFELFRWQIFIIDTISDKPLVKRNRLSSRQIILFTLIFALFNLSLCICPLFFSLFVCLFLSFFRYLFFSFSFISLFLSLFVSLFFFVFPFSLLCLYLSWIQYPSDEAAFAGKHYLGFLLLQKMFREI